MRLAKIQSIRLLTLVILAKHFVQKKIAGIPSTVIKKIEERWLL